MRGEIGQKGEGTRAAVYARVSSQSQAEEDKTSLFEQMKEIESYCERRGFTVVARYQEVGRGWSKKRPEFQRMLADARQGRFDVIVCWKSDRLSRGLYVAAALMEVLEAHDIGLESVMDAIDMKYFGIVAAIGKIELDNLRERSSLGKRGAAKLGRVPTGSIPYGYRIGADGRPEVEEAEAAVVQRIFRHYVHEGLGAPTIAWQLTDDGIPTRRSGRRWQASYVHRLLGSEAYKGTWMYGRKRKIATEDGARVHEQSDETWIPIPFPPLVDEATWNLAQRLKQQRRVRSKRNTRQFYLLQKLVRCADCGRMFGARSNSWTSTRRHGKLYRYHATVPRRYYRCYGADQQLCTREHSYIRAEGLEELVWGEVRRILQSRELIAGVIRSSDADGGDENAEQIEKVKRELRDVHMEDERAIRLFVSGRITERQLDRQRGFIAERQEILCARLDDYRARQATSTEKRLLMESVLEWAARVGEAVDGMSPEERREILRMVVDEIVIDGDDGISIILAIPFEESVAGASQSSATPN